MIARWNAIDNSAESYSSFSPYHFVGNNPLNALEIDGNNYILLVWASKVAKHGHVAIAVQNYKTNADGVSVANGYTVYEASALDSENLEAYINNPNRVSSGMVTSQFFASKDDLLNMVRGDKGNKADGIIEFASTPSQDISANAVLQSDVSEVAEVRTSDNPFNTNTRTEVISNGIDYSLTESNSTACTFSCTSYAAKSLNILYGLNTGSPENINLSSGYSGFGLKIPPLNLNAYTPNRLFSNTSNSGTVLKGNGMKFWSSSFLFTTTGVKDDTPTN